MSSSQPSQAPPHPTSGYFPKANLTNDGWSTPTHATATCYCGSVQLKVPTTSPGLINTFVCNCFDCRKITGSMFASNFTCDMSFVDHLRGQELLKQFSHSTNTWTGKKMTNYFCGNCGALMYRMGEAFPGTAFLRIGTVDDFSLMEGALKPGNEQFIKDRVGWLKGVEGVKKWSGLMEDSERLDVESHL